MTRHNRPRSAALLGAASLALAAGPASAADLVIEISIPEQDVATYYRPYIAAWIEVPETKEVKGTVAVWYDTRLRDNLGAAFLRDLRTWWRATGEGMTLPADGVSGPTRAPGTHTVTVSGSAAQLAELPAGEYILAVEASREKGGREVLRTPFLWGGGEDRGETVGSKELARVQVKVQP